MITKDFSLTDIKFSDGLDEKVIMDKMLRQNCSLPE